MQNCRLAPQGYLLRRRFMNHTASSSSHSLRALLRVRYGGRSVPESQFHPHDSFPSYRDDVVHE